MGIWRRCERASRAWRIRPSEGLGVGAFAGGWLVKSNPAELLCAWLRLCLMVCLVPTSWPWMKMNVRAKKLY